MSRKNLFSAGIGNQTLLKEENANLAKKEIDNSIISNLKSGNFNNDFIKKGDNKKTDIIKDIVIEDDADEWSAVPAFLRRKK